MEGLRDKMLYLGFRGFLGVAGRLPPRLAGTVGRSVGRTTLGFSSKYKARLRDHLELVFPELEQHDRDELMKDCARHFGLMLAEIAWLSRASAEDVAAVCQLKGESHLLDALAAGHGAMMVTAHCGNWELLSARISVAGIPLTAAARSLDERSLDSLVTTLRTRFGTEVVARGPGAGRHLARALVSNRVVGLLIDQDIPDVSGVFVPFLGRPAWTPSGAAKFALRFQCPVIPAFTHRRPDGTHVVEVHPPLPMPTSGSMESRITELTAASAACTEAVIRAHPEQWVWMHRRWRTQPESAGTG